MEVKWKSITNWVPHEDGEHCLSNYGVSEIKAPPPTEFPSNHATETLKRIYEKDDKFQIYCRLDPIHETSQLTVLLNDIYNKALTHMEDHGSAGTNMFLPNKKYTKSK
jgi:hypothetical protein